MDIKQLQAMGAIVSRTLHKKEVKIRYRPLLPESEWTDPKEPEPQPEYVDETLTTWIRKKSSADFIEMLQADDRDKALIAVYRCVCHEDGTQVFESLAQVSQVEEWLIVPLIMAVNEVNGFGLKNSTPRASSGAKSRSLSAAVPSQNGKTRSARKNSTHGLPTGTSADH